MRGPWSQQNDWNCQVLIFLWGGRGERELNELRASPLGMALAKVGVVHEGRVSVLILGLDLLLAGMMDKLVH